MLEIRSVSKSFDAVQVLDDVSLTLSSGEILALMGENGSGKSTLIKILAGYHAPDPGVEILLDGDEIRFPMKPGDPRQLGLSFVHQDLGLVHAASVTENLFIGQFAAGRAGYIRWRSEHQRASRALERFGLGHVDPTESVGALNAADRASVAIVRACYSLEHPAGQRQPGRAGVLVLDETTSFLPDDGVLQVLETVRRVAREGHGVIFVSHRLDEVFDLCDSVTVLRDGRVAMARSLRATSRDDLVRAMTGADGSAAALRGARASVSPRPRHDRAAGQGAQKALGITDLVCASLGPIDLDLHRGEIVGVTGLLGSGFEELPYALFGGLPARGSLEIDGRSVRLGRLRPAAAMRLGFGLVPADRTGQGGITAASVADNVTMLRLGTKRRLGYVSDRAQRRHAEGAVRSFDIRPARTDIQFRYLSGGNQQKAIIAKWSDWTSKVLLIHEPTRGVDIAAKGQILKSLESIAGAGATILIASSDCSDLASVCDRVVIISKGRISSALSGEHMSEQGIQAAVHDG